MNTSELIVKTLEHEGAEVIFGIPGEENVAFLDAIRQSNISYVNAADERGATFMAVAYGRLTGRPGIVSTTLGPGALNIPNGLAYATLAGIPLIALTWQKGCRTSNKDHGFMYVNVVDVVKPLVKYQQTIYSPKQVVNTIRQGYAIALTPNFGAVHIEVPEDVSEETVTEEITFHPPAHICASIPDQSGILAACELILQSKTPLVLVGFNASNSECAELVRLFCESTGIHCLTTPMAQGILPSDHPLSLFSLSSSHDDDVFTSLKTTDLVITIGYNTLEFSPKFWNNSRNAKIIHINSTRAKLHHHYNPNLELVGDITSLLLRLNQEVYKEERKNSAVFAQLRTILQINTTDSQSFPIKPQHLVDSIRKTAKDALIVHDNGIHKLWMTRFFHPDLPNQVLVDNALASMGSGLPQGIAAQLLHPNRKILINTGEGGLMMCLGEMSTAAANKLPLVILVWHDGNHGMIDWHQQKRGLQPFGISITSPDFVTLAESFGGVGYRVTSADMLEETLTTAFSNNRLTIIDCPVDYSENLKVFYNSAYESGTN